MDFLNSQHLTNHDGFVQPFREAGDFTYFALVSDFGPAKEATIKVERGKTAVGKGQQHDVVLHWDAQARCFAPREEDLRKVVRQNDFVVFQFDRPEPGQPPCFIQGRRGDQVEFDSRHLCTHQAFSHFFLAPGEYSYRLGRNLYRVSVADHRQFSVEDHGKRAQEAVVILIKGDQPSLKHAKIVAGQTVVWAVEKGENLSIEAIAFEDAGPEGKEQRERRPVR